MSSSPQSSCSSSCRQIYEKFNISCITWCTSVLFYTSTVVMLKLLQANIVRIFTMWYIIYSNTHTPRHTHQDTHTNTHTQTHTSHTRIPAGCSHFGDPAALRTHYCPCHYYAFIFFYAFIYACMLYRVLSFRRSGGIPHTVLPPKRARAVAPQKVRPTTTKRYACIIW